MKKQPSNRLKKPLLLIRLHLLIRVHLLMQINLQKVEKHRKSSNFPLEAMKKGRWGNPTPFFFNSIFSPPAGGPGTGAF